MGCRVNIPDFVSPECPFESGRVVAFALIHKDIFNVIKNDPSNPAVWVDQNYSSDLHIYTEVAGPYSGGQPTEIPGLGKQASRVINAEHTLGPLFVEGVKGNEDHWNEFVKSDDYRVAFVIGANYDLLMLAEPDVSIFANVPVEGELDSAVYWNVTIKWRDVKNPITSDVPTGIFTTV